eukprot:Em0010g397a
MLPQGKPCEGDLSDEWLRFKREFQQSLTAIRKEDATEQVKLAIFLRIVDPRAICNTNVPDIEATAADLQHLVSKKTEMVEGETAGVALVSKKRYRAQKTQKKWQQWRNKVGKSQEENRIGQEPIGDPEPNQPGKQWSSQAGCSRCGYDHKLRQCPVYRKKKCQMSNSGSEEAVLLITVEKIGKKLLAKMPLTGRTQVQMIECQLDTAATYNVMAVRDYEANWEDQGEYNIETDPLIPPVQNRLRRIPHVMKALVIQKLRSLEESGMIALLTAVWKADKTQVRLSEHSSNLTTLWGPDGRYRWLRMPFGLSSAPEEFQRSLKGDLHGIQGVVVVADDILVFRKGQTEKRLTSDPEVGIAMFFTADTLAGSDLIPWGEYMVPYVEEF